MAYATGNPKTKKALKDRVAAYHAGTGSPVYITANSPFGCREDGAESIEGPHFPAPHRWYAQVEVQGGIIIKVK